MHLVKRFIVITASLALLLAQAGVSAAAPAAFAEQETITFGTSATQLEPGTYAFSAELMNASDITKTSGAASCVKGAELTVAADGAAKVRVQLGTIEMFGLVGAATQWKVYQADEPKGAAVDATVVKTAGYTDANGAQLSFDEIIEFALPDTSRDGVYVNMYVSAMQSTVNAYLHFDFAGINEEKTYAGTVQVDQFGKYDVKATVTVKGGRIVSVVADGENYAGAYIEENKAYMAKAFGGMKDAWTGMSASPSNAAQISGVDTVSGATFSSEAIRDAVLKALGMEQPAEVINVPASLEEGTYSIDISYYTDVVRHYLTGAKQTEATLKVDANGKASIATGLSNGVPVQLYITDIKGYYRDNDTALSLTTDGLVLGVDGVAFSDENFAEGTKVVWEADLPLAGPLAKEYVTRVHLYVPAMKAVMSDDPALIIDHGDIDVDAYLKVYWDSRQMTGSVAVDVAVAAIDKAAMTGSKSDIAAARSAFDALGPEAKALAKSKGVLDKLEAAEKVAGQQQATQPQATDVVINAKTVSAKAVKAALKAANNEGATIVTLGAKVKKIAKGAFAGTKVTALVVKTKKLTKKNVKGSLKGSKVKTVQVKVGSKKANKKVAKKYKKIFTKKVAGKKAKVK